MKKIFLLLLLSVAISLPALYAHADDAVPKALTEYVKAHPDATPDQILQYANATTPDFASRYSNAKDLVTVIHNNGATYAFGGSRISQYLKGLLQQNNFSVGFIILAIVISILLGALHALSPGHGKTIVAAYLVGSKGRVIDAVILGLVVTATHTGSVLLLGLVALFASQYILPQTLFPYFSLVSGLMVLGIGLWLLVQRLRRKEPGHNHGPGGHSHGHHAHAHHDDHNHGHTHNHAHYDEAPHSHDAPVYDHHTHSHESPVEKAAIVGFEKKRWYSRKGSEVSIGNLILLGMSGGIVPCPDALIVLLIAVALNQIALGLAIVVSFSIGLAFVLIAIGVLMVVAKPFIERFTGKGPIMRVLPIGSAIVVIGIGVVFVSKALAIIGFKI